MNAMKGVAPGLMVEIVVLSALARDPLLFPPPPQPARSKARKASRPIQDFIVLLHMQSRLKGYRYISFDSRFAHFPLPAINLY